MPPDQQRRLVSAIARWIGGGLHPPRRSGLVQALTGLRAGKSVTLGGVRFRVGPRVIRAAREPRAVGGPMSVGAVWDGRWLVQGPGGEVRALAAAGLAQLPDWRRAGIARDALVASPGVWDGAQLVAAPLLGHGAGFTARLTIDFRSFLLRH